MAPVLLVPSTVGEAPYRRMIRPPLPDRFRIVHVDIRGEAPTFENLADDFEAARAACGADAMVNVCPSEPSGNVRSPF